MPDPEVVWLKGGHLAMLVDMDNFLAALTKFIAARNRGAYEAPQNII